MNLHTAGNQKTILIVEDNFALREGLREILEGAGYYVQTAVHGQDAVEVMQNSTVDVDLILCDMVMPLMGGRELYRVLKQQENPAKFVLMTGYPLEQGGKELLEEGILSWIEKPFSPDDLINVLESAMETKLPKRSPTVSTQSWP